MKAITEALTDSHSFIYTNVPRQATSTPNPRVVGSIPTVYPIWRGSSEGEHVFNEFVSNLNSNLNQPIKLVVVDSNPTLAAITE